MLKRTITAAFILVVSVLLIIFSNYIVYPIVLSILAVIGVFEILRVMGSHKRLIIAIPAYICAAAFPTLAYFVTPETNLAFILIIAAAMFTYLLYLMGVSVFSKGKIPFSLISEVFTTVLYVTVSITSMSLIRYLDRPVGAFEVALVFGVAWACDVFAFLVGSAIGKHKLIPEISPKKTVEGAVGGVVCTVVLCLAYGYVLDLVVADMVVDYLFLAIIGVVLPIVSQLGDLVASLIKREYGVKDYGKLFPGHGGVVDRFDSVFAVSTVLLILCIIFPPFTIV